MWLEDVVNQTIADYVTWSDNIRKANGPLVAELVSEVDAVGMDSVSDFFFDVVDEAKGKMGSNAADRLHSPSDQEAAIERVESWFADNVSNAGAEQNVICAIWGHGPEQASADIRTEIADNAPKP